MQIQEQNVTSNSEGLSTQLSYPKQVEIWRVDVWQWWGLWQPLQRWF